VPGQWILMLSIFVGVPWLLVSAFKAQLSHQRFMKVLQLKSEMNARLLDRAGSDPALLELLKGEAQQQLFDVKLPGPALPAPYARVVGSIQAACLLLAGGVSLVVMRHSLRYSGEQAMTLFLGTLAIGLGIGALVSAAAMVVVARLWQPAKEHA
jgi:hypothetical protein